MKKYLIMATDGTTQNAEGRETNHAAVIDFDIPATTAKAAIAGVIMSGAAAGYKDLTAIEQASPEASKVPAVGSPLLKREAIEKLIDSMKRAGESAQTLLAEEIEAIAESDEDGDEADDEISEATNELIVSQLELIAEAAAALAVVFKGAK